MGFAVFPAYAGVNPYSAAAEGEEMCIPRVCGGEPFGLQEIFM